MSRGGIWTLAKMGLAQDTSRGRRGWHGLRLADCQLSTTGGGGGGGGGSWSPPSIAGNILQFVADLDVYSDTGLTTPQTTNSGVVHGWKDQSASAKHATNSPGGLLSLANLGTNNRNGVKFDASTNRGLSTASMTLPNPNYTVVVVWASASDTASFSSLTSRGNGDGGSLYHISSTRVATWFGGNLQSSAIYAATQSLTVTTFRRKTSSTCEYWKDGTADAANPQTQGAAAGASDVVVLGCDSGGGSSGPKTIGAMFLYDNAISDADRISLHTYLGTYYGITMGGS